MFGDVSAALIKSRPVKFVLGFVVCIIISILCFELAARFFLPDMIAVWRGLPFGDGAIQFVSAGAVQNIDGFPTYRSNADVRLVVFYPDGNGNPVKEYDCSFRSDQNGFVSNEIEYSRAKVLLLGDSFSVGFGGCEWVSRLKTDFKKKVYVAAHGGFGPIVWKNVVSYLEEKKRPEKILIVFVTDDFFRPGWLYSRTQLDCINFKAECETLGLFPITANMEEVAKNRIFRIRDSAGPLKQLEHHLVATTTLIRILKNQFSVSSANFQESVAVVSALATRYDVKMLWVSERRELTLPDAKTRKLAAALNGKDITHCKIPSEGFMPRDNHPNVLGYDILKACVEGLLRTW